MKFEEQFYCLVKINHKFKIIKYINYNTKKYIEEYFSYEKANIRNIFIIWILGFSRYIEHCKVIEDDTCIGLKSGKKFNFSKYVFEDIPYRSVYRVYFEGNGYRNLY